MDGQLGYYNNLSTDVTAFTGSLTTLDDWMKQSIDHVNEYKQRVADNLKDIDNVLQDCQVFTNSYMENCCCSSTNTELHSYKH